MLSQILQIRQISQLPFYLFTVRIGYCTEKWHISFWNPPNTSYSNQVKEKTQSTFFSIGSTHTQTDTHSGLFCSRQHVKPIRKKILFFQGSRRSLSLRLHRYGINTDMASFHWYSFNSYPLFFTYITSSSCSLYLLFITEDSEDWKSQLKNM